MCEHRNFKAQVCVNRIEDVDRFVADVSIQCGDCGVQMQFIGLPCGLNLNGAAVSTMGTEARLAIAPEGEVVPPIDGPQGFSIRQYPGDPNGQ